MKLCFASMLFSCSAFATVYQVEHLLECEGLNEFPNGTYDEIEIIDFSKNNFPELTPNVFADCKLFNVTEAILRSNNIASIHPDAFALMSNVSYLDLYGNKLKTLQKDLFRGFISLKILLLVDNQIESIEKGALESLPMLEKLDLSYNHITKLDKTFLKYNNVSELNLNNNPIVFPEHGTILESLTLIRLLLENCDLTNLPTNAFNKLPKLEYLNLSRNKLRVFSRDLLKPLENLGVLDISHNLITVAEFYLPTNLHTIYWEEAINCRKKFDVFRRRTSLQPLAYEENQTEKLERKIIYNENEDSNSTTLLINNEKYLETSTNLRKISEADGNKRSTVTVTKEEKYKELQTSLMYAILGASAVCAVFLLVLVAQIYCFVTMDKPDAKFRNIIAAA